MAHLFQINDRAVFPNPETLLIYPFKEIWERDESPKKEVAIQELAYIEFATSMLKSNPYREYPEDKKDIILKKEIMLDENWEADELIFDGIKKIEELQAEGSITYTYWMSNKSAIEKMIDFFNTVDISEKNFKTGNPIYKPRDITSAVADAEKILTTLTALKSKVDEEIFEMSKTRSDKKISPFANPDSLK
jgi:hypothetical protein